MDFKQPGDLRALLLSALKGGVIAVAAPIVLGLFFMMIVSGEAQEGVGWMLIAGVLAAPVIFLLGAGGGVLAHAARSRAAGAPVGQQTTRWARVGWTVAGALAGLVASGLTNFQWPMIGGALIGMALVPVWMWVGAIVGRRVADSKSLLRPVLGGVLAAVAAYAVVGIAMVAMVFGHVRVPDVASRVAAPAAAAVVGLYALWRLRAAQPAGRLRESPSADPSAGERDR